MMNQDPLILLEQALQCLKEANAERVATADAIANLQQRQAKIEQTIITEQARIDTLMQAVRENRECSIREAEHKPPPTPTPTPSVKRRGNQRTPLRPSGLSRRDELLLCFAQLAVPSTPSELANATRAEGEEHQTHYHSTYAKVKELESAAFVEKQADGRWLLTKKGQDEAARIESLRKK